MASRASSRIEISSPSDAALGYLAGILDGEGTFVVSERTNSFGLRVQMLDRSVIDWLRGHFAGSVSPGSLTVTNRRAWRWTLQRQADLRFVLDVVEPFLIAKGSQARAMLSLLSHLRAQPRHPTPTSRAPRHERARRRQLRGAWDAYRLQLQRAVRPSKTGDKGQLRLPEIRPPASDGVDFGYLAGILDGEGYFMPGIANKVVGLRVQMVDSEVIAWLGARFRGRVGHSGRTSTGRTVHEWRLQRRADLRPVLSSVAPLLVCKSAQARAMLAWVEFADLRLPGQAVWDAESLALRRAIREARHARP